MKRFSKMALMSLALLVASFPQPTLLRAQNAAELSVARISGPTSLQAGLSGTYEVTIRNDGNVAATVELHIVFAGALDQTGQIVADAGLACEVGHDAGINAAVRCTGGQVEAGGSVTVVVQGRGQTAGEGQLVATINASRSVLEFGGGGYDNNLKQFNVTIN
jgi:hypothetical protein